MLSIITRLLALVAVMSLIGAFIPDSFTASIDQGIQFFAAHICYFETFINTATIYSIIQILLAFFITMIVFVGTIWFLRFTGGTK